MPDPQPIVTRVFGQRPDETYEECLARRKRERKVARRKQVAERVAAVVLGVIAVIVIAAIFVLLAGIFTMLAWNIGVVGIAAAAGTAVGKVSLGVAIFANIALGILGRLFHGPTKVEAKTNP